MYIVKEDLHHIFSPDIAGTLGMRSSGGGRQLPGVKQLSTLALFKRQEPHAGRKAPVPASKNWCGVNRFAGFCKRTYLKLEKAQRVAGINSGDSISSACEGGITVSS